MVNSNIRLKRLNPKEDQNSMVMDKKKYFLCKNSKKRFNMKLFLKLLYNTCELYVFQVLQSLGHIIVSSYMFLFGFSHFCYFFHSGDFSVYRLCRVSNWFLTLCSRGWEILQWQLEYFFVFGRKEKNWIWHYRKTL